MSSIVCVARLVNGGGDDCLRRGPPGPHAAAFTINYASRCSLVGFSPMFRLNCQTYVSELSGPPARPRAEATTAGTGSGLCPVCWAAFHPTGLAPGSGREVECVGEAVEEVAASAKHLDQAGRDRVIRCELPGDDPTDFRARGEGEVDRSVPARHVQG
jgi:hypothetical protein